MKYLIIFSMILFIGCSCNKKIKYVYVKQECPVLQTFEYNLSKDEPIDLHIKIKDKQ